jgi:hypothetical protein
MFYRRIAKATGGTLVLTLADMDGNESFDPSLLGTADEVHGSPLATERHGLEVVDLRHALERASVRLGSAFRSFLPT